MTLFILCLNFSYIVSVHLSYDQIPNTFVPFNQAHYGSSTLGRPRQKTSSRRNVRRRAHSDDSFFSTGLVLQEPQLQTVRGWLVFQVLALILQFHFWQEVRGNLFVYESTLSSNCASERTRHGICVGPLWNVSAWEEAVLQGRLSSFGEVRTRPHYSYSSHLSRNHFDSIEAIDAEIVQLQQETALRLKELQDKRAELQVVQGLVPLGNGSSRSRGFNSTYIFQFETRSSPAVLLMSVDPVSRAPRIGEDPPQLTPAALEDEHEGHHWSLEVKRIEPPPTGLNFQRTGYGTRIMTIEDMSQEAVDAVRQHGHVRWEGILRNVEMSAHRTRFVIFVEDFQSHQDHLEKMISAMSGTQCSLTASWRAFNRQHQGHRHRALTRCRDLLGCFLPLGALATWVFCWHLRCDIHFHGTFSRVWNCQSGSNGVNTCYLGDLLPKAVYARLVTRTTQKGLAERKDDMSPSMELTEARSFLSTIP